MNLKFIDIDFDGGDHLALSRVDDQAKLIVLNALHKFFVCLGGNKISDGLVVVKDGDGFPLGLFDQGTRVFLELQDACRVIDKNCLQFLKHNL